VSAKLTVCMIVRDEEAFLPGALLSVRPIADELVIGIDDRTTDATERIARMAGARVHRFTWSDDFSAARNIGLSKARKDWILMIDADDRLTEWGRATLVQVLRKPDSRVEGYCFQAANCFRDGRLMYHSPTSVRLWPNHSGVRYAGRVHEQPTRQGRLLKAGILRGGVMLQHLGYDPQIKAQRGKDERNLRLLQLQYADHGQRVEVTNA